MEQNTVFVIHRTNDEKLIAVCSTKEKADRIALIFKGTDFTIKEFPVDKLADFFEQGKRLFSVTFDPEQDVTEASLVTSFPSNIYELQSEGYILEYNVSLKDRRRVSNTRKKPQPSSVTLTLLSGSLSEAIAEAALTLKNILEEFPWGVVPVKKMTEDDAVNIFSQMGSEEEMGYEEEDWEEEEED